MNDHSPGMLYTPPGKLVETRPYQEDPARGFSIAGQHYGDEGL